MILYPRPINPPHPHIQGSNIIWRIPRGLSSHIIPFIVPFQLYCGWVLEWWVVGGDGSASSPFFHHLRNTYLYLHHRQTIETEKASHHQFICVHLTRCGLYMWNAEAHRNPGDSELECVNFIRVHTTSTPLIARKCNLIRFIITGPGT